MPDIVVYTQLPRLVALASSVIDRAARTPGLRGLTRRSLTTAISRMPNPSDDARARSRSQLWGCATASDGRAATARLSTPNSYDLTADAVVRIARALADGAVRPGALTPALAFGAGFVERLDGVSVTPPLLSAG